MRAQVKALAIIAACPGISTAQFTRTMCPPGPGCGVEGLTRRASAPLEGGSILEGLHAVGWVRVESLGGIALTDTGVHVLQEQGLVRLLDEVRICDIPGLVFIRGHRHPPVDDTMSK